MLFENFENYYILRYITIQVKPTFAFDPYFECPPHLLLICSKMRPISPKTMLYQNDRVDETVVGT